MQSSLKKSLYLGLAALTFASVAGASVSATSTNANAAKHVAKKVAKKVTYKVTNSNLDQKVVYTATGSNAIYSKPGTVKGAKVVASKATMASLANSKKATDQFMAYQEVTTSKGAKYLKVVSFDKKIRGYVYVSGVQSVDATTTSLTLSQPFVDYANGLANNTMSASNAVVAESDGSNASTANVVLLKSAHILEQPYGTVFGVKSAKFYTANTSYQNDKFAVDKAVQVSRTGDVYLHVIDVNNSAINGWINQSNVSTTVNGTLYSKANAVHVSYVDASTGKTVFTADHTYSNDSSTLASSIATDAGNDATAKGYTAQTANYVVDGLVKTDLNAAKNGSNVTVFVSANANANKTQAAQIKFNLVTMNTDGSVSYDTTSKAVPDSVKTAAENKLTSGYAALLQGKQIDLINYSNIINTLFAGNGSVFNKIATSSDGSYTFDANATSAYNNVHSSDLVNGKVAFGTSAQVINVFYTKDKAATSTASVIAPKTTADTSITPTNYFN